MVQPLPGDFGLVRTDGWFAHSIRYVLQSEYNHAVLYLGDGQIIEARPRGAKIGPTDSYSNVLWSTGKVPLTDKQRTDIVYQGRLLEGTPYSWLDIAALAIRMEAHIDYPWIDQRIERMDRLICSQLVDRAHQLGGSHLFNDGRLPQSVTPQDLYWLVV